MVVFFGVAAVIAVSKWYAPPELVPWQNDLGAAQEKSRITHQPVLLYFTAEWCGPCQSMRRHVWSDPQVAEAAKAYIPVRVDVDKQAELALKYKVEAMPLFLVLDDQGQIVRRINRAMEADETIQWLRGGK
jgi:thiol:disulfide interchange protein